MSRVVAMVVGLALMCAPAWAESVTFEYEGPPEGGKRTTAEKFSMSMDLSIAVNGEVVQEMSQEHKKHDERQDEVLGVGDDGTLTRVKATYVEVLEEQSNSMGQSDTQVGPHKGKTYIVEQGEGDTPTVTDAEGNAVPAEEESAVASDFGSLGQVDKMSQFLSGKSFAVGEPVSIPPDLARTLFSDDGNKEMTVEEFTLTLTGTKEAQGSECGVFDATLVMSGEPQPGMSLTMSLSGELVVTTSCWPVDMDLAGDITMEGGMDQGENRTEFSGSGPVTIQISATYE